jgi:hypothetical protein
MVVAAVGTAAGLWSLRERDPHRVTFKRRSGDLVGFFVSQATNYGARPKSDAPLPTVEAHWQFATDPEGFQILMAPSDTERLVQALAPAFGQPERRQSYPHIIYRDTNLHVFISIGTDEAHNLRSIGTTNHHLICVREGAMERFLGLK